jgi:hypothetical protein
MITITQRGSFDKTETWLTRLAHTDIFASLHQYGQRGVDALAHATPVDSGETASSWYYEIVHRAGYFSIRWRNRHVVDGVPIAIVLEYGHGTRNGGFVQGHDYIMPAIRGIFDQMANDCWREVTK